MNDALLVRRFERLRDLLGDGQRFIETNGAARDALRQILAFDEFHHQRDHVARAFNAVDGGDVGMIQRREHFRFALKTREPIGIRRDRRRKYFQCDLPFERRIGRAVDLAHPADAELLGDFVRTETSAGNQGQTVGL